MKKHKHNWVNRSEFFRLVEVAKAEEKTWDIVRLGNATRALIVKVVACSECNEIKLYMAD